MVKKKIVARNPLAPRETITPEQLRPQQSTGVRELETKKQVDKVTSELTAQPSKDTPSLKRYATYLQPASIRRIKHYSIDKGMTDYEVVQAAVDEYLKAHAS